MRPSTTLRRSRSVSGCLICRRREVKCTSRSSPCEKCSRLGLSCVASFQQNIRVWSVSGNLKPKNTSRTRGTKRKIHTTSVLGLLEEEAQAGQAASPGPVGNSPLESSIDESTEWLGISLNPDNSYHTTQREVSAVQSTSPTSDHDQESNPDLPVDVHEQPTSESLIDPWIACDALLPLPSPSSNPLEIDDSLSGLVNTLPGQNWDVVTWAQDMNRVPD
ncbi:hypothetical protein P170DRAFT_480189 [Aspergillus steynii IBT 23096]|uniref:Zn(2)-C6 fungal-type domain-containing protein n=1 Tax=Aspergillus steynii IBT 23096 TaxID=1392250 RepID=A0A2I2FUX6_9EURO|nr:uncharacterized protein P170DRAFT_480189 [Aspergillus steynii IBT 23096]PLB44424.1 hypothetical protein P170DRAFT_480189 [Aspergillus steynii IBT 23096]